MISPYDAFLREWNAWTYADGLPAPLPPSWRATLSGALDDGLNAADILELIPAAMDGPAPRNRVWPYYCGCLRNRAENVNPERPSRRATDREDDLLRRILEEYTEHFKIRARATGADPDADDPCDLHGTDCHGSLLCNLIAAARCAYNAESYDEDERWTRRALDQAARAARAERRRAFRDAYHQGFADGAAAAHRGDI